MRTMTSVPACWDYFGTTVSGEVSGSVAAKQLPNIICRLVWFSAPKANGASVYLGGAGVTIPDGVTDATSGSEIEAGETVGPFPALNVNQFYIIGTNAADDITYIAMR